MDIHRWIEELRSKRGVGRKRAAAHKKYLGLSKTSYINNPCTYSEFLKGFSNREALTSALENEFTTISTSECNIGNVINHTPYIDNVIPDKRWHGALGGFLHMAWERDLIKNSRKPETIICNYTDSAINSLQELDDTIKEMFKIIPVVAHCVSEKTYLQNFGSTIEVETRYGLLDDDLTCGNKLYEAHIDAIQKNPYRKFTIIELKSTWSDLSMDRNAYIQATATAYAYHTGTQVDPKNIDVVIAFVKVPVERVPLRVSIEFKRASAKSLFPILKSAGRVT